MSGICFAEAYAVTATADLPGDVVTLLDAAEGVFAGRMWWDVVLSHAMPAGAAAAFVAIRDAERVLAVVPLLRSGGRWSSLTTPYSCEYAPVFAAELGRDVRSAAMRVFGAFCRSRGVVRLDALPDDLDGLDDLRAIRFDHFGNWHEDVSGLGWADYIAGRPGALRETIRRRQRRAEKLPDGRFCLFTDPADLDMGIEAFESVYRRSWKEPEPFPSFNAALMRATAEAGLLRLGVWFIGSDPVSVQFWVVKDGRAIVLKLAHDEAFKAHSPGTVLMALMLRHLLDREHVRAIDFGRGDDGYKRDWAVGRRQRIGVLVVNPMRPAGAMVLLRHAVGRGRSWLGWGVVRRG